MLCPKCNQKTKVVAGRSDTSRYHRQRKCLSCGHIFYTVETAAPSNYDYALAYSNYKNRRTLK